LLIANVTWLLDPDDGFEIELGPVFPFGADPVYIETQFCPSLEY
jgi:hypothetical protein